MFNTNLFKETISSFLKADRDNSQRLKSQYPDFYAWLSKEYPEIPKAEKLHRYLFGDPETTICLSCGKPTKFNNVWKGFSKYCSYNCSNNHDTKKATSQATLFKNYGVTNPSKNEEIQATKVATNWDKYGAKHYMSSEAGKAEYIKLNQEKYGADWYVTTDDFKKKSVEKCQLEYGVNHPHQTAWYWEKHPTYNCKPYVLKNGETVNIQGYDGFLLDYLIEKGYDFEHIKYAKHQVPKFKYIYAGERMYFPDAYIESSNTVYEAKSDWTFKTDFDRNMAKREAVISNGFCYQLIIFNKDGSVSQIIN